MNSRRANHAGLFRLSLGMALLLSAAAILVLFASNVRLTTTESWMSMLGSSAFWTSLWLSLITTAITTCIAVLLGIPAAYLLSRQRGRLSAVMDVVISLPVVLPASTIGLMLLVTFQSAPLMYLQQLFGSRMAYSQTGIILAQLIIALAIGIRADDLSIELGEFALHHVNLEIAKGEYCVLLGPTGSGKTVLLECLAGIHQQHEGRIFLDEQDVTAWMPEDRGIGYVPQDYALFPNMTVEENIGFGLRARSTPKDEIKKRSHDLISRLELDALKTRDTKTLSGGEQQRAALGRALAVEPAVLLLDEPLSALDEHLRWEVGAQLRQVHEQFNTTLLHVCHNFEEAAQVADRLVVMNAGRIEQVGSLDDILRQPANLFVARFTQSRNLLPAQAARNQDGCRLRLADGVELQATGEADGPVTAIIRPEWIRWLPAGKAKGPNNLEGQLIRLQQRFAQTELGRKGRESGSTRVLAPTVAAKPTAARRRRPAHKSHCQPNSTSSMWSVELTEYICVPVGSEMGDEMPPAKVIKSSALRFQAQARGIQSRIGNIIKRHARRLLIRPAA